LGAHPGLRHGDGGPGVQAEGSTPSVPVGESNEIELQMAKLFGATIRLFASVMLISTTALAQQKSEGIASPPTKEIEKHFHNYGNFDNTCIRWTDKCRNCSRSTSGDDPVCSNIGIACEPAEVECLERQQDGEKK
jgi:hypothetical protein